MLRSALGGAALLAATVSSLSAPVTWTGATNNTWDTVPDNWSGLYTNGDDATFDLLSGGSVILSGVIAPASTTVSAAGGTFAFEGSGITSGTLAKSGGGTLILNNSGNIYAGSTTIDGGTLRLQATATTSPASIPGLVVHLDANDVNNTGTNPPDGSAVTTWVNKVPPGSGCAGDFTSPTTGGTLASAGSHRMNGLSVVYFTGAMLLNTTNFGNNVTILYVGRMNGGANRRLLGGIVNNWLLGYWNNNQNVHFWEGSPNVLSGALDYNNHIFMGWADGTNATASNFDGAEITLGTAPVNQGPNGLALGGDGKFSETSFGAVGELLVFNRALTPTERLQMAQYLQSKWMGILPHATAVSLSGSGATLELNDENQTVGSLAGVAGSTVSLSDRTLTAGGDKTDTTFSGVLSGTGAFVKHGTGTLTLDGAASNSHTGTTSAIGGTLILAKTGGAKGLGGDLSFLNGPSPDVYTYENEQFASGAVVSFEGNNGDHGRLDLYGTTQTVAGIQTLYNATRGVIQNREYGPINEGNSTLILNGSADYFFNGYLRNGSGTQFGTLSLVKNGTGTQVLAGAISYTGPTALNDGTLERLNAPGYASPTTIASGATMKVTNTGNFQGSNLASIVLNDGSTLVHNGQNATAQYWVLNAPVTVASGAAVSLRQSSVANVVGTNKGAFIDQGLKGGGSGAVVTIDADNPGNGFTFRNNNTNFAGKLIINGIPSTTVNAGSGAAVGGCTLGLANADIEVNGTLELLNQGLGWAGGAPGDFWMGALDGSGVMIANFIANGETRVRVGSTGTSGTFSGEIANGTGNVVVLTKVGAGTQTFTGTNSYTGNTIASEGNLVLDFEAGPVSDILSPDSALVLAGGNVEIKGGPGELNTQQFDGITATSNGTLQLTLNGATSVDAIVGNIGFGGASINFAGADTSMAGVGNATRGSTNFITTTVTAGNDGSSRLGANLWNGTDWISTASDGAATTYIVPWQGTYTDIYNGTDLGSVAIPSGMPGAEVHILESASNAPNTLGADETINSLLMDAGTTPATLDMMGNTLTVGNGAAAFGSIGLTNSAQSLTIGSVADDGILTSGETEPSAIGFVNENPASSLIVNSVIADNPGPPAVDPDPGGAPAPVSVSVSGAAGASVVFNGTNTYTGATYISGGTTLQIGGGGTLGSGSYASGIFNEGTLRYSSTAAQTITGAMTGAGSLTKDTSFCTLTLAGAGIAITGQTTVATGTLNLATTTGWRSPTVVESGAVLQFGGTANAEHGSWTGDALTLNDGATLNKTNTGYDTMNAGNLIINGTVSINITNNGSNNQLFVGGNATPTGLTGSGTINLTNTGTATTGMTLRYSASQPHFDGTFNVSGGVLNVGDAGAGSILDKADVNLTAASFNIAGAFAVAAANASVKSLSGDAASAVTLGGQTLTIGTNDGESDFAGVISGAGGIVKSGTGLLALSGANTYTGSTQVSTGTLGGTGSVDSPVTVASAATIAPGASVGTFTVNAATDFETGATLLIEVDGASADRLDVTGSLDVDGAVIDFVTLNAPTEASYVIASAGSITGTPTPANVPAGYGVAVSATEITLIELTTPYDLWANDRGLVYGVNDGLGSDPETDLLANLLEFAFGTDPLANDNLPLVITSGTEFTPGTPSVRMTPPFVPTNIAGQFVRRKDAASVGLTYVPEFSADLATWETDPANPAPAVVSTQAGDYEVVEVPYLIFLSSGQKATYFRIRVNATGSPVVNP